MAKRGMRRSGATNNLDRRLKEFKKEYGDVHTGQRRRGAPATTCDVHRPGSNTK